MSYARTYGRLQWDVTLWSLLLVAVMADVITTIVGLQVGYVESNPLLHVVIGVAGFTGLAIAKAGYVAAALWVYRIVDYGEWAVLAVAVVIEFAVVGINLYVLSHSLFADLTIYEVIGA